MNKKNKIELFSIISKPFLAALLTGTVSAVISTNNGVVHILIGIGIGLVASISGFYEIKKAFSL